MISGTSNTIKYYKYLKHYFEVELVPIFLYNSVGFQ